MIDRAVLTAELKRLVLRIEDDLRARAATVADIDATIAAQWEEARTANRTRRDAGPWRETLPTQVAVGWVRGSVFIRLSEDHARAKFLADAMTSIPGVSLLFPVETNMVFIQWTGGPDANQLSTTLRERGILTLPGQGRTMRLVTHLDAPRTLIESHLPTFREALKA